MEGLGSALASYIVHDDTTTFGALPYRLEAGTPFDVAFMLDKMGVAVRSGHHCAQPALRSLGVDTCVRASVAFYNEERDIDVLCDGLERLGTLCR